MENLMIPPNEQELVTALHNMGEDIEIPMPFERDIFLFGTEIAGTQYAKNIEKLYDFLNEGDLVALVREPDNPHDEYAIRIETADSTLIGYYPSEAFQTIKDKELGYIPRINNKIIARLMDAGKIIYGVIRHKEIVGDQRKIVVKVYLKEI